MNHPHDNDLRRTTLVNNMHRANNANDLTHQATPQRQRLPATNSTVGHDDGPLSGAITQGTNNDISTRYQLHFDDPDNYPLMPYRALRDPFEEHFQALTQELLNSSFPYPGPPIFDAIDNPHISRWQTLHEVRQRRLLGKHPPSSFIRLSMLTRVG